MGYSPWRNASCEGESTSRGIHLWKNTCEEQKFTTQIVWGAFSEMNLSCRFKAIRVKFVFLYFKIWLYFSQTLYRHNSRTRYYLLWWVICAQLALATHRVVFSSTHRKMLLWKLGRVSDFVYQSTPIKNKIRSLKCRNFKLWSCFIALYILLQMKHLRTKANSSSVTCNRSCNTFYSFSCISEFVKISCKRRLFANAGQVLQNE